MPAHIQAARRDAFYSPDQIFAALHPQAVALWVGRLLFGGFFAFSGIHHFLEMPMLSEYAASKGVPFPAMAVAASGLLVLAGGLSVLAGVWPRVGAALIALFLVVVTPAMHDFWREAGTARALDLANFTKNVALLGGASFVMAFRAPWRDGARA
jgi:uncharacterized membrane protein YphA (DoxX/SURF4 family)